MKKFSYLKILFLLLTCTQLNQIIYTCTTPKSAYTELPRMPEDIKTVFYKTVRENIDPTGLPPDIQAQLRNYACSEAHYGETALLFATKHGSPSLVRWLLANGAAAEIDRGYNRPEYENYPGPLHESCDPKITAALLEHGANPKLSRKEDVLFYYRGTLDGDKTVTPEEGMRARIAELNEFKRIDAHWNKPGCREGLIASIEVIKKFEHSSTKEDLA